MKTSKMIRESKAYADKKTAIALKVLNEKEIQQISGGRTPPPPRPSSGGGGQTN